jgi:hypothetical protein
MNVFLEFHEIVQALEMEKVPYAVIGGVAMAFHSYSRFTKDIDLLTNEGALLQVRAILEKRGYLYAIQPWTFKNNALTLHRFWKGNEADEMIIDVLISCDERHDAIIQNALEAYSEGTGVVRVATRDDLVWLKSQRGSAIDQVDIQNLLNETDEKDN